MPVALTSVDVAVVGREGGSEITITGTGFDLEKLYNVHVGTAGDATDPACYAGQGKGINVEPTLVTQLKCRLPELTVGTVLDLFVVRTDAGGDNDALADVLTVIEAGLSTAQFSIRRQFAPNRRVGNRNFTVFPPTDAPKQFLVETDTLDISPWAFGDASAVSNPEDPFGGSNGWDLNEGSLTQEHYIEQVIASAALIVVGRVYTAACYVKASNRTFCSLDGDNGGDVFGQVFDLTDGVVGATQSDPQNLILGVNIKAVDLVTAWYRVSITFRASNGTDFKWRLNARDGDNLGTFAGLTQQSILMSFPSLDPYPLSRAYREAGATPIT